MVREEIPNRSLGRIRVLTVVFAVAQGSVFLLCVFTLSVTVCVPFVCPAFYTQFNKRYAALFPLFEKCFFTVLIQGAKDRGSSAPGPIAGRPSFSRGVTCLLLCKAVTLHVVRGLPRPFSARLTRAFFSKAGCLNPIRCALPL